MKFSIKFQPLNFVKIYLPLPKRQNLDSSKLKKFTDDNFEFDYKWQKNIQMRGEHFEKRRNCSFSRCVFKRLILQTRTTQGWFEKGLNMVNSLQADKILAMLASKTLASNNLTYY